MNKFYITAAIPYVNGAPHIGHALEFVQLDVISRYKRKLFGEDNVLSLTGADENSLKNVQAAEKEGVTTQELCDRNSKKFQDLIEKYNIRFDIFQRSTSENHKTASQKLWNLCQQNDDIYKKTYTGLYCVGCEAFYTKDELTKEGLCPEHLTPPQEVSEENYFFRLSKYQKEIEDLISSDKIKITPQTRKNEVLSFVRSGLEDFSISRSSLRAKNWGIDIPEDATQKMYVWFDALNVYQSGIGFGTDEKNYLKWWPADIHLIGKGIIRFHAVYWIGILLSAKLSLPKNIFVHGYITVDGQKMSKSLGNVVDPYALVDKYGVDPVRYYLLREIPSSSDGDFSETRFKELYNSDLANGLGNLVARVAKLCEKNEFKNSNAISTLPEKNSYIESFQLNSALEEIWKKVKLWDVKVSSDEPWKKTKEEVTPLLQDYVNGILEIARSLYPFLPQTSEKIVSTFETPQIKSSSPLFPRIAKDV